MKYTSFIILVVLATVHGGTVERVQKRDVPQRCLDNPVPDVDCANVPEDALLPHPSDCQLFFYCVDGDSEPICRQCPANLHFNPTKHVCDIPEYAGCSAE